MISFIIGYAIGAILAIIFVSLVHRTEKSKEQDRYYEGFLDGIQSLR